MSIRDYTRRPRFVLQRGRVCAGNIVLFPVVDWQPVQFRVRLDHPDHYVVYGVYCKCFAFFSISTVLLLCNVLPYFGNRPAFESLRFLKIFNDGVLGDVGHS